MTDIGDGATWWPRDCTFVKCVVGMLSAVLFILPEYGVSYRVGRGEELRELRGRGSFA